MIDVECSRICKSLLIDHTDFAVIENVSFNVSKNEFVSIIGPSGCGKTTLLKLIAGLLDPTSGKISCLLPTANNRPTNALVFQNHGLFPWLTVLENTAFGLEARNIPKHKRDMIAHKILVQIGLSEFEARFPHQLSIGMQQRVAVARAFAVEPHILLMDEPFSALDAQTKIILQEELLRLWKDHRHTVIFVTHDIEEAILLSDRILVMSGRPGTIIEEVPIPIPRPRHPMESDYAKIRELKWRIWKMLEPDIRRAV